MLSYFHECKNSNKTLVCFFRNVRYFEVFGEERRCYSRVIFSSNFLYSRIELFGFSRYGSFLWYQKALQRDFYCQISDRFQIVLANFENGEKFDGRKIWARVHTLLHTLLLSECAGESSVLKIDGSKSADKKYTVFMWTGDFIRQIFHRFQNVPESYERRLRMARSITDEMI